MKALASGADIAATLLFASSFFVKDNKKAVNRRWTSLGIFGVSILLKLAK